MGNDVFLSHKIHVRHSTALVRFHRQRGVVAIMFAVILIGILGIIGLALDLSRVYNRSVEMRGVANAAAMAAARNLDGTSAGIENAIDSAAEAATSFKYEYDQIRVSWSDAAITFSTSASEDGQWLDASAAKGAPDDVLFVKVDTSNLAPEMGTISTFFMGVISNSFVTVSSSSKAIAGRSTSNATPIAICAMSSIPAESRGTKNELVQYGFRRGVGYDLMKLGPTGTAENFVINPIDPPGKVAKTENTSASIVGPFVCSGTVPMGRIVGSSIRVSSPFPLSDLHNHLNSRFGNYTAGYCKVSSAPPDANIKAYVFNTSVPWMTPRPTIQTAASTSDEGPLQTIADLKSPPATTSGLMYGPLWSFARAVPYSSYKEGESEPHTGYTTFNTADWQTLYNPGKPVANSSYPNSGSEKTPYATSAGSVNFLAPSSSTGRGVPLRRVLNVPLLDCPVAAGTDSTAKVLAVGRFFMTVPATETAISAEFGGIASGLSLGGEVELYK